MLTMEMFHPSVPAASEQSRARDVWKGFVAGAVAGLCASWVMNRTHALLGDLTGESEAEERLEENTTPQRGEDGDATARAASAVSETLFHHTLSQKERKVVAPIVHYTFGSLLGGVYGAVAEVVPLVTTGAGIPFATGVWLFGDEMAVPALGFTRSPKLYPLSTHARALAAHVVYGVTTETVRTGLRSFL
jgi:uncharacterized membrane protein YagU involved in acid resistance